MTTQNTQDTQDTHTAILTEAPRAFKTLADSYNSGHGNTFRLYDRIFIDGASLSYLGGTLKATLDLDTCQKDVLLSMFIDRQLKDKATDYIERYLTALSEGRLSLNHSLEGSTKVSVDKYAQFKTLFDSLGVTEVRSNGKGSKLTQLICTPTPETVTILSVNGFSNITPLVEDFAIVGLKVELPKAE